MLVGDVVIYVDEETFEDIKWSIDSVWNTSLLLFLVPAYFAFEFFSVIYIPLALYIALTPLLMGFFFVMWWRYRVYGDVDFSFFRYAVVFVLIFLVFNVVAFFFWFSMPRGPGIIYVDSYFLEFSSLLAVSAGVSFLSVFFLKSLLDFGLWVRGRFSAFPFINASLERSDDGDYYVVYVNRPYVAFVVVFFDFILSSWAILTSLFVTVFTLLHILLVLYVVPLFHMLGNDTVREMVELRVIIVPRAKEGEE